jgi:hypothetical protein
MTLYIKDSNYPTKKPPRSDNTFSNVTGYKINIQKSVSSLYTNNEQAEKEMRKPVYV